MPYLSPVLSSHLSPRRLLTPGGTQSSEDWRPFQPKTEEALAGSAGVIYGGWIMPQLGMNGSLRGRMPFSFWSRQFGRCVARRCEFACLAIAGLGAGGPPRLLPLLVPSSSFRYRHELIALPHLQSTQEDAVGRMFPGLRLAHHAVGSPPPSLQHHRHLVSHHMLLTPLMQVRSR